MPNSDLERVLASKLNVPGIGNNPMSPEEFVARLHAISIEEGVPYGRVHALFKAEADYGASAAQFKGYLALSDAFKALFLETTELLNGVYWPQKEVQFSTEYVMFLPRLTLSFQSLCGAERVALKGYPYLGYTVLRNVFDSLVLISAALQKFTDFYSIEGVDPNKSFDSSTYNKLRKKTERTVRELMTGPQSGLTSETIAALAHWDALFDHETHGARLSLAGTMGWMKGTEPLEVLPKFDSSSFAMFMNRYCEIAWMIHRLLPLTQTADALLPVSWGDKWRIVDDSFERTVFALEQQLGKKIGGALKEFVKAKFPFEAASPFPL